jgi:hypothetical protein
VRNLTEASYREQKEEKKWNCISYFII